MRILRGVFGSGRPSTPSLTSTRSRAVSSRHGSGRRSRTTRSR